MPRKENFSLSSGHFTWLPSAKPLCLLVLLALLAGCGVSDQARQDEIKEKVGGGDYEEAARLAHQYFSDDKRILLVMLEYIGDQKSKADKEAYKDNVVIQDVDWSTDRSGGTVVVGRVLNQGDKIITGFGISIVCKRDGKTVHAVRAAYPGPIPPGMSEAFRREIGGLTGCHDISIDIVDLGLKD
jgi:hypothetical protein